MWKTGTNLLKDTQSLHLGKYQNQVEKRLDRWVGQNFSHRIWAKDPSLWLSEQRSEITDRLGWLALPERMAERCDEIMTFARQIKEGGFAHVLLLGMGGSSLAPEVFQKIFGKTPGFPELLVLDSTHPDAILDTESKLDIAQTLILVSSKSGTTLETLSLFRYFWARAAGVHDKPGRCFIAITDAGSPLEKMAREKNFRRIFLPDPDVGGRYSALSEFGLVPAALVGIDIQGLLHSAQIASRNSRMPGAEERSAGFILGAALGELAGNRDKLTIWTSPQLDGFPVWLEQLIAESTGKMGKGIVPVVEEPEVQADNYGGDRVFAGIFLDDDPLDEWKSRFLALTNSGHPTIRISLKEKLDIGREIFHWELATASAGAVLGIHPFNQPDVQLAKDLTREAMEKDSRAAGPAKKSVEEVSIENERACASAILGFLEKTAPCDYIAIQAYLPPTPEILRALQKLKKAFLLQTNLATTMGFGPRFLHSTGQLHKGGPNSVLAIQVVDEPKHVLPIPGMGASFADIVEAQSRGDFYALRKKRRRVLRISLGKRVLEGLTKLESSILG